MVKTPAEFGGAGRDLRIDFFRGLALYMIIFDHIPGAGAIIKSGRSSLQVFCLGAVLTVILNLFIAVEGPGGIARVILDCATILLIAWIATVWVRSRPDGRQIPNVQLAPVATGTTLSSDQFAIAGHSARLRRRPNPHRIARSAIGPDVETG